MCVCLQYEDTQSQLSDLRQRYERTEQEKLNIHQELEQCRSSLKLLQDKSSSVSAHTNTLCSFMIKNTDLCLDCFFVIYVCSALSFTIIYFCFKVAFYAGEAAFLS